MTMQLIRYSINCFYTFLKHSLRNSLYSMSAMKHWGGKGADVPALVFIKSIIGKYPEKIEENQNISSTIQLSNWLHENRYLTSSFQIEKKGKERTSRKSRSGKGKRERVALDLIHESHAAALLNCGGFSADNKSRMNGRRPVSGEGLPSLEVFTIRKTNQLFASIQSIASVINPETSYLFTRNPVLLQNILVRKLSSRYSIINPLIKKSILSDNTTLRNKQLLVVENRYRNDLQESNTSGIDVPMPNIFHSILNGRVLTEIEEKNIKGIDITYSEEGSKQIQRSHVLKDSQRIQSGIERLQKKDYLVFNKLMYYRKPLITRLHQIKKMPAWLSLEKPFTDDAEKQLKGSNFRNTMHPMGSVTSININKKGLSADEYFVFTLTDSNKHQNKRIIVKRPGVSEKLMIKKYRGFHMVDSGFTALSFSRYSDRNRWNTVDLTLPKKVYEGVRNQNTELVHAKTPGTIHDVSIKGSQHVNLFRSGEMETPSTKAKNKNEITVASTKPLVNREILKIADKIYDLFEKRIELEKSWKG